MMCGDLYLMALKLFARCILYEAALFRLGSHK